MNLNTLLRITLLLAIATLSACSDTNMDTEKSIQIHLERSTAYKNQGQLRAAIIEARNLIKIDKSRTTGYKILAQLYIDLGNYKNAISILEPVKDSKQPEVTLLIAKAYAGQGKFISAQNAAQDYLDQGGETSNVEYKLLSATILAGTRQYATAIAATQSLIEEHPDNLEARILLSSIYLTSDRYDLAKANIAKTLQDFPREPEALYMAAQIARHENQLDNAERLLSKAMSNMPETDILLPIRLNTLSSLSTVLTQQGRTTEALIYSKLIAEYSPEATDAKIKFSHALELLNAGEIDAAEEILLELYATYPNNEKTAFYLGLINYQKGELNAANSLFSSHLDAETAPERLIETAALSSLRLNKTQEAISILEKALLTHKDNPLLLGLYGASLLQNPDTEEAALLNIQKSLAIDPNQDNLRLILARFYLKKSLPAQANAHLELILKNDPGNIAANSVYLDSLLMNGDFSQAEQLASAILASNTNNPEAINIVAKFHLTNQRINEAKELYQKSVELDPANLEALNFLAYIAAEEKLFDQAISYYQSIIRINPSSPLAYKNLFSTIETYQGTKEAISALLSYTQEPFPNTIQITANTVMAEYYSLNNDLSNAKKYLAKVNLDDNSTAYSQAIDTQIQILQAKQAMSRQDWNTARSLLMKTLNSNEQTIEVSMLLVNIELQSGRLAEAQSLIKNLETQFPAEDSLIIARARLYELQGKTDKALNYLQSEWGKNHSPVVAYNIYQRLNAIPEQQVKFLSTWSTQQPDNDRPLIYLALIAQRDNNNLLAIDYYKKATQINPQSASTLNNLAWLYYETNNSQALETARKAYELAPENAAILDTYGWIMVVNGDKEAGTKLLEQALEFATPAEIDGIKRHIAEANNS